MTKMQEYMQKGEDYILKTYNRYPVVFEKGDGVCLYDMDGKRYLDFAAGIAVFALGYNNKAYNDALKEQIDKILHTSNLYYNNRRSMPQRKSLRLQKCLKYSLQTVVQKRLRVL